MTTMTAREYKALQDSMKEIKNNINTLSEKVGNLSDRLIKLETVFKLAFWAVSASGLIGSILGIIHIFKALTN